MWLPEDKKEFMTRFRKSISGGIKRTSRNRTWQTWRKNGEV